MLAAVSLDHTHITVHALEKLLPEAVVAGGSFGADLEHPIEIPRTERQLVFENAQAHAIDDCLQELCDRVGLPKSTRIKSGPGGERLWPSGFVGSLTHKGTVVLGALAASSSLYALGIDIEFVDASQLGSIEKDVAWEGLPTGVDQSYGILLALSAKEAIFKAQYPLTRKLLSFSEVPLVWTFHGGDSFSATVKTGRLIGLQVRCLSASTWIVSAAVIPTAI